METTSSAQFSYTVYYRRRDGHGTRVWDRGLTRSEAIAQRAWCFKNAATDATVVWVLDETGAMFGEALTRAPDTEETQR